jgi:ankyrin repeat domain-containing protein 50
LQGHPRNTWTWTASSKKALNPTALESKPGKLKRGFWRKTKKEEESSNTLDGDTFDQCDVYWPYHLLPTDCPNARILTWGYDSDISKFFSGSANKNNIFAHSRDLLEDLIWERRNEVGQRLAETFPSTQQLTFAEVETPDHFRGTLAWR